MGLMGVEGGEGWSREEKRAEGVGGREREGGERLVGVEEDGGDREI